MGEFQEAAEGELYKRAGGYWATAKTAKAALERGGHDIPHEEYPQLRHQPSSDIVDVGLLVTTAISPGVGSLVGHPVGVASTVCLGSIGLYAGKKMVQYGRPVIYKSTERPKLRAGTERSVGVPEVSSPSAQGRPETKGQRTARFRRGQGR
jgi:hypothetical protein